MSWEFEKVAGPYKGRTGGLAWDGKTMLFSAVQEERILRFDPETGKADVFRELRRFNSAQESAPGYAEAAGKLGLPENSVKSLVHRMRRRYRALLREIGRAHV